MSEVKRYTVVECHNDEEFWVKMKEVKHGEYVLYSNYEKLKQQNEQMLEALKFIKEFGYNNPGCGFSCAKVADDTIESITNKRIDEGFYE